MLLAARADLAQRLKAVGVVDQHLVLLRVDDVEQAVLFVDRDSYGIDQDLLDLVHHLVLGVEDQHLAQLAVGDEDAVVVIDGTTLLIMPKWASKPLRISSCPWFRC